MEFENLGTAYMTLCRRHQDRILFRNEQITFGGPGKKPPQRRFPEAPGIQKGDVVILLAGNSVDGARLHGYHGHRRRGAAARYQPPGRQYRAMAQSAGAKAAFVSPSKTFFRSGGFAVEDDPSGEADSAWPDASLGPDDIAALLFTSGTRATKIVALTHRNILSVALTCTRLEEYTPDDVTWHAAPVPRLCVRIDVHGAARHGPVPGLSEFAQGSGHHQALADNPSPSFRRRPRCGNCSSTRWRPSFGRSRKPSTACSCFFLRPPPRLRPSGWDFFPGRFSRPCMMSSAGRCAFSSAAARPSKRNISPTTGPWVFYIMEGYGLPKRPAHRHSVF